MDLLDNLDTQVLASGSTIALVGAAIKLLYGALKEERERTVKVRLQADQRLIDERAEWRKEKDYLMQEIATLRSQVADLYSKLYKKPPENP